MNPKIAIIIANYNYEKYVMNAINSALNQTYDGEIRIYVVDDGSNDGSWEKISEITTPVTSIEILETYYSGQIEFRQSNNIFAYRIKNSGASVARNVAMWQAMEWADVFGILDSDDEYYPEKVKKQYIQQVMLPNKEIFDSRLHGPGSEGFIGCLEDYDLWIRLSKVCIMCHVPECLAIANEHGANQSLKMTNEIFNKHAGILGGR